MKTLKFKNYKNLNEGRRGFRHYLFTDLTPKISIDDQFFDEMMIDQLNDTIRDAIQDSVDYNNDWEERVDRDGVYITTAMKNLEIEKFDPFLKNGFCNISNNIEETFIFIHIYAEIDDNNMYLCYDGIPELYHSDLGYDTYDSDDLNNFIDRVIEFQIQSTVDELEEIEYKFDKDELDIFKGEIAKEINKMTNAFVSKVEYIIDNILDNE